MKQKISITIEGSLLKEVDSLVDNIYVRNRSMAIEGLLANSLGSNRSAVILAGGEESGLELGGGQYSITSAVGKCTLVEHAIRKLRENGFKKIFIVAGHTILTSVFDILKDGSEFGIKVNYIEEKSPKGTAATLRCLRGKLTSNFLVVYGDIYFSKVNIESLWEQHLKGKAAATLMLTTSPYPQEKGTVIMEGSKILEFAQKPRKSEIYLVFSPIFACDPELFEYRGDSLEYDVFPALASGGLLAGHISSTKEIHIHKQEDIRRLMQ